MLLSLEQVHKTIGTKVLYEDLDLTIQDGEKVGFIGRNGTGKSTLLGVMDGTDDAFTGHRSTRRGLVIASTAQEHHGALGQAVISYVLDSLPEYAHLKQLIDTLPATMGDHMDKIARYTDALNRFGELGYYDIEDRARQELVDFQIPADLIEGSLTALSGGQKRFVELAKVTLASCDLALIDEPTNHMDYIAKEAFIEWLEQAKQSVVVITHDRDVLASVDRIVELKDRTIHNFNGDYESYLKQNGRSTMNAVEQYEFDQRTLANLHKQVMAARAKKTASAGKSQVRFTILENRLKRQYDELASRITKPSFWIDAGQLDTMQNKMVEKYDRYKAKNIRIHTSDKLDESQRLLLDVDALSLGFDGPLFDHISFSLHQHERRELKGRNGVGKSTLVRAILKTASSTKLDSRLYGGTITLDPRIRIGLYEQEIDEKYLSLTLADAVTSACRDAGVASNDQRTRQLLADYLFDPSRDGGLTMQKLSGGEKARFQIIKMMLADPSLLILDEPTNHLDLPSIEELEKALDRFTGAILYVSHDSYFTRALGGEVTEIAPVAKSLAK
jgi:ATP-binding cassette subfamily F protein 3